MRLLFFDKDFSLVLLKVLESRIGYNNNEMNNKKKNQIQTHSTLTIKDINKLLDEIVESDEKY